MTESTCILSVIVPVYNVEKYLRDCLDSLLMQDISENEYEIICVDDGSKDSSPEILDEYAEKHPNIRVIHKENGGVSSARNVGIEQAKGEYLWFVDSDDSIALNCLGYLFHLISVHCPVSIRVHSAEVEESHDYRQNVFDKTVCSYEVYDHYTTRTKSPTAWGIIIKRLLALQIDLHFMQGVKYSEDSLFVFEWFIKTNGTWVDVNYPIYSYRQVSSSVMHTQSQKSLHDRYQSWKCVFTTIKSYGEVNDSEKQASMNNSLFWVQNAMLAVVPKMDADYKLLLSELKQIGAFPMKINWNFVFADVGFKSNLIRLCKAILFQNSLLYNVYYCIIRKRHKKLLHKQG